MTFFETLWNLLRQGKSPLTATAWREKDGAIEVERAIWQEDLIFSNPGTEPFWEKVWADLPATLPCRFQQDGWHLLVEKACARPRLILCGGGHIAQPLAEIGALLDFDVVVIDDREEFANPKRFPFAAQTLCMPFPQALDQLGYGEDSFFVIITRGHQGDRVCLETILNHPFGYVGMIGSRKKVAVVMEEMERQGYSPSLLEQVHAPIGLRIGAQTPAEIAVCIAAQLIQVRSGASGGALPPEAWELLASGKPAVLATILEKQGSAPRGMGAKLVLDERGTLYGTIGGGNGEAQAIQRAKELLGKDAAPAILVCDMTNTDAQKEGMVCGGKIHVLIEAVGASF